MKIIKKTSSKKTASLRINQNPLFSKIATLIQESKQRVAISINSELTMLYWNIGNHIKTEILNNRKADYGQKILVTLSQQLTENFGKGWGVKQLQHCLHSVEAFPDEQIVYTLCRQLTWSHLRTIMYIDNELKREFYIEICQMEGWSVRQLNERINSMLYERTAISKKPEETIKQDLQLLKDQQKLSPDLVFRDPYFLDFLGLKDTFSEKDLETAIISELQRFILELGNDFAFLARQKQITIDNENYKIDLLFYHRKLKCLVAIDLKLDKFKAAHKGQMELYLRWLEKYEVVEGENSPIGLILCADSNKEHIELLRLDESKIKVAAYLTELPPIKLLQEKLHKAISIARNNLENNPRE